MRHLTPLLLAMSLGAAGCAATGDATAPVERDPKVVVYVTEVGHRTGVRLHGALVEADGVGPRAAVQALTTYTPEAPYETLWAGACAPGEDLDDVSVTATLVTVRFRRSGDVLCDLSDDAVVALEQQLAWTVARATGRPTVPVVVTARDGHYRALGPVTAQRRYLPASQ
jgi:hypothetical protein